MKKRPFLTLSRLIALIIMAWAAMLVSCKEAGPAGAAGQPVGLQQPPEAASAEITAALEQQGLGSKLLGLTSYLVKGNYVKADLPKAPRYYLLNFSGST
mgnify:FL=1